MKKIKIFCTTIKYYKIMDKLPSYIIPVGLGSANYPDNWPCEKNGSNIMHLNRFYAEFTGFYYIKNNNFFDDLNDNDLIGNCHNRVIWLNSLLNKKSKIIFSSLYKNFLTEENALNYSGDVTQVQPITFKNKNLFEDWEEVHKCNLLKDSLGLLEKKVAIDFEKHLKGKEIFPHNMFITNKTNFNEYYDIIMPWLDKCYAICKKENLCLGYQSRIPAFLAERFTSFWFSRFKKRRLLSYARLGKFHLSNKINKFINSAKLPFTFYQYPTIHRY